MKYCAAYYSDIGIQKETNQDSLLLVQRGHPLLHLVFKIGSCPRSDLRRRRWTENGRAEQRSGRDSLPGLVR